MELARLVLVQVGQGQESMHVSERLPLLVITSSTSATSAELTACISYPTDRVPRSSGRGVLMM